MNRLVPYIVVLLAMPSLAGAQSSTLPNLSAATSAADADLLLIRKSGETRDKKITKANLFAGVALVHKICTTIESPTATDNLLLVRMDAAATVTGIHCLAADGTSVVATYRECDGNGATCSDIESAITCGTTDTTNSGGIDNSSLDAGDWVRLVLGTNTGTVTQLSACIYYTVN